MKSSLCADTANIDTVSNPRRVSMQRTAVQASPDQLTAIGGRWVTGAQRHQVGVHPFRKSLATLRIGDSITPAPARSRWRTSSTSRSSPVTPSTPTWTRRPPPTPLVGSRVTYGYLIVAWGAGLFVDP